MKVMIEPSGPLAQLVEQLTLNQPSLGTPRTRTVPKRLLNAIPNSLYLEEHFLGGESNEDIVIIELRLLNKKGGESHEDAGGSRWLPV